MTDRLPILWHSNAPHVSTGYGQQTALFAPRIAKHYDLQISSFYGLDGAPIIWNGIPVLPGLAGTYGNETIPAHARRFFGSDRGGLIFTLMDVWVLEAKMCQQFNVASWCPVDHDPAPPKVIRYFEESGAVPIAMARFGQERLERFDPLYVPHAVDTSVYRPLPKASSRETIGVGADEFAVGVVAANKGNPSRKCFVAALQAFATFRKRHENAKLYLHTDVEGVLSAGVPLGPVIQALDIPEEAIGIVDPYTIHFHPSPPETMALFYSSMDVLLSPSAGEGFGIPVLESQACGTPPIVTDFSAQREVCGAGWKVGWEKWWTPQWSWQALPHVSEIAEALEECYSLTDGERERLSVEARTHASRYDVERVLEEYMLPALERVQERVVERDRPAKLKRRVAA